MDLIIYMITSLVRMQDIGGRKVEGKKEMEMSSSIPDSAIL